MFGVDGILCVVMIVCNYLFGDVGTCFINSCDLFFCLLWFHQKTLEVLCVTLFSYSFILGIEYFDNRLNKVFVEFQGVLKKGRKFKSSNFLLVFDVNGSEDHLSVDHENFSGFEEGQWCKVESIEIIGLVLFVLVEFFLDGIEVVFVDFEFEVKRVAF